MRINHFYLTHRSVAGIGVLGTMYNYEDFCDHCHRAALVIRHDPGVKRPYLETPVCADGSLLGSCLVWELERFCHLFSVVKNEGAGALLCPMSSPWKPLLHLKWFCCSSHSRTHMLPHVPGQAHRHSNPRGKLHRALLWDNFILNTSHQSSLITGTDQGSAGPPPVFSHSPGTMPEPNNVASIPLAETL